MAGNEPQKGMSGKGLFILRVSVMPSTSTPA
jgi:hypothetical protein